jgi:CheY-like chemotaxis protein
MMKTGLELHGYVVFAAADGPSGLRSAREVSPQVIVIDLGLPGLDGYEVARQLRARPGLTSPFLIALTGYGQPDARERALDAGFDAHLTKPVAPDELSDFIASRLGEQVADASRR